MQDEHSTKPAIVSIDNSKRRDILKKFPGLDKPNFNEDKALHQYMMDSLPFIRDPKSNLRKIFRSAFPEVDFSVFDWKDVFSVNTPYDNSPSRETHTTLSSTAPTSDKMKIDLTPLDILEDPKSIELTRGFLTEIHPSLGHAVILLRRQHALNLLNKVDKYFIAKNPLLLEEIKAEENKITEDIISSVESVENVDTNSSGYISPFGEDENLQEFHDTLSEKPKTSTSIISWVVDVLNKFPNVFIPENEELDNEEINNENKLEADKKEGVMTGLYNLIINRIGSLIGAGISSFNNTKTNDTELDIDDEDEEFHDASSTIEEIPILNNLPLANPLPSLNTSSITEKLIAFPAPLTLEAIFTPVVHMDEIEPPFLSIKPAVIDQDRTSLKDKVESVLLDVKKSLWEKYEPLVKEKARIETQIKTDAINKASEPYIKTHIGVSPTQLFLTEKDYKINFEKYAEEGEVAYAEELEEINRKYTLFNSLIKDTDIKIEGLIRALAIYTNSHSESMKKRGEAAGFTTWKNEEEFKGLLLREVNSFLQPQLHYTKDTLNMKEFIVISKQIQTSSGEYFGTKKGRKYKSDNADSLGTRSHAFAALAASIMDPSFDGRSFDGRSI
jgi:hypothetical protein